MNTTRTVSVIGAGIQGCTVALYLAQGGFRVNLIDQSTDIYNRASYNQEGKVHLGFTYALDNSFQTSRKMLEDALQFAPVLESLFSRKVNWAQMCSAPFRYLISRESLASQDFLVEKYERLQEEYYHLMKDKSLHYLGLRPEKLYETTAIDAVFNPDLFTGQVWTEERAISPVSLKKLFEVGIEATDSIQILTGHMVEQVRSNHHSMSVLCRQGNIRREIKSDLVINAAWEGRRVLDTQVGLTENEVWSCRLKCGLIFPLGPAEVPTFIVVQGPFGDYVNFPTENRTYFSWYPACMIDQILDKEIPDSWQEVCDGNLQSLDTKAIIQQSMDALKEMIPGFIRPDEVTIRAGTIMAQGFKSISDPDSTLHARYDPVIRQRGGYFSIHTSKLTSAPNNARKLMSLM